MILKFDKFVPLKTGEISVMLTAQKSDFDMLVPLMKTGKAELRPVGADVMPESRIILQNISISLTEMLEVVNATILKDAEAVSL